MSPTITDVRFERFKGTWDYEGPVGEERLVRPVDIYPDLSARGNPMPIGVTADGPPYPLEAVFIFIETDAGVSGCYGPISLGEARTIDRRLKQVVIGEPAHAVERIWDRMYRSSFTGRKGETMMAISKVDLALWDLKGKLLDAPVYELLGGPSRERVRAYASMLGHAVEPEMAAERAREVAEAGYTATKWFFRHGPADGPEGLRKNLALIRAVREAVGPDVEIMFDAWSSWDVPYTQRMAGLATAYRPWWFEEPVLPDLIPQYAELRRTVATVAISGGEHEYTRWGIKALLDAGAVDILQPDPTWAGGITEMMKICALASAYGIPVIPHHGGRASLHLIAAQTLTTCPIQEWLVQHGRRDNLFFKHKIEPENGAFALPPGPGLSMALDETTIESREEVTFA
jgi:L-alanine-DL-glutamate epimerase-like enolase superfamily enzyme